MDFETLLNEFGDLKKLFLNHRHKGFDKSKILDDSTTTTPSTPEDLETSVTAGESVSANDALYISDFPAVTPTFDNWNSGTVNAASLTASFTIGSGANRILIVAAGVAPGRTITGITYNGVAMTAILTNNAADQVNIYSVYYILAPASGANNIVVTADSSTSIKYQGISFYNVAQQAPEASTSAQAFNNGTASATLTPLTTRALIYCLITNRVNSSPTGTAYQNHIDHSFFYTAHSNEVTPIQAMTLVTQADNSGFSTTEWMWSFAAATTYSAQRAYKSSALKVQTSDNFIGFATASAATGDPLVVAIAGVVSAFSSLVTGSKYYLSDTYGAIAASAGTVTRKIGLAISDSIINITNIW